MKLKPCPFCLSDDIRASIDYWNEKNYRRKFWFACCPDCGARGPIADTEKLAIEYWNDRPEVPKRIDGKPTGMSAEQFDACYEDDSDER